MFAYGIGYVFFLCECVCLWRIFFFVYLLCQTEVCAYHPINELMQHLLYFVAEDVSIQ